MRKSGAGAAEESRAYAQLSISRPGLDSLRLVVPSRDRKVDHVEPGEDSGEDRPEDGAVPLPGAHHAKGAAETDSGLRDGFGGLRRNLSRFSK